VSRPISSPLALSARLGYFNISDFDARIYTYENDLLLEYFTPSWNGEGIRGYVHMRYKLSRNLLAEFRYEHTKFLGIESISSGNTEIDGDTQSRIKAQLRWTF